jgi:hypothetical protein
MATSDWIRNLIDASGLKPGEGVLVVVDDPLAEQGVQLAAAAGAAGANVRSERWSVDPPVPGGDTADVLLFMAHRPGGEEASSRMALFRSVMAHGGRVLILAFVDRELLEGELSEPALDLSGPARALLGRVEGLTTLRVTGTAGTDLTFRIDGRPWLTDATPLEPGKIANFPSGEIFVAPHRDGADGVLVADLTVPFTVPGLVDEPVRITFERGRVTAIEGGRAAGLLRELVDGAGEGADVIAELGIGLNPAIRPRGHIMLDEKAAGTAHVAIGGNVIFGGDNASSIHVDCVFSGPTLYVDGVELPI